MSGFFTDPDARDSAAFPAAPGAGCRVIRLLSVL
jgi:hypothetical protein